MTHPAGTPIARCSNCIHARVVDQRLVRCVVLSRLNTAIVLMHHDAHCAHHELKEDR